MAVVVLAASAAVFLLSKPIGAYQLGESYAQNMGVNIRGVPRRAGAALERAERLRHRLRRADLLCGDRRAASGAVVLKTSRPLLVIPVCFLGGAIFCLGCDLAARTLFAPMELSISSVTAVVGAPVVIGIMLRKKVKG